MKKIKYNFEQITRLLFQIIFGVKIFNIPGLLKIRNIAYRILFHSGPSLHIGNNVLIDREHQKYDGSIQIGEKVKMAGNNHIDYTGHLIIKDKVIITRGVTILTHYRDIQALRNNNEDINIQTTLLIEDNVYIGTNATILPSCSHIGKNAIIGAGAVVTKDVPENTTVAGIPAQVIKRLS